MDDLLERTNTVSAAPKPKTPHELADEFHAPVPQTESGSLMNFIQRAASDPTFDVGKLERLLALQERQAMNEARIAYFTAMRALKNDLPVVERNGRIVIHEKGKEKIDANVVQSTGYARWEDIDEAITPILDRHGFALTFRPGVAADGKVTVTAIATHTLGHSDEATVTLPHDSSGSKNPVQAVASALSYGKRLAATLLLNIRTKGDDDDGKAAGDPPCISPDQLQHIRDVMDRIGNVDVEAFCKVFKIEAVPDLRPADYERAMAMLNTKAKKLQKDAPK